MAAGAGATVVDPREEEEAARAFSALLADPAVLRVGLRRRLAGDPAPWVAASEPTAVATKE